MMEREVWLSTPLSFFFFFFFNLEDPANHLKVIGLIIRPSSREILFPPAIMELLNFAAGSGKC